MKKKIIVVLVVGLMLSIPASAWTIQETIDDIKKSLQQAGITGNVIYRGYAIAYCRECTSGSYYQIPADPQYSYTITDNRGNVWTYPTRNAPKYPYSDAGLAQAKARVDTIILTGITRAPAPTPTSSQPTPTPIPARPLLTAAQCASTYSQYSTMINAANVNRDTILSNQEAATYITNQYFLSISQSEGYVLIDFALSGCTIPQGAATPIPGTTPKPKIIPPVISGLTGIPETPGFEAVGLVGIMTLLAVFRRKL